MMSNAFSPYHGQIDELLNGEGRGVLVITVSPGTHRLAVQYRLGDRLPQEIQLVISLMRIFIVLFYCCSRLTTLHAVVGHVLLA